MPLKQSEAIVLRTYPLREADLLVTLFTRQEGKLRGGREIGQEIEETVWRRPGAADLHSGVLGRPGEYGSCAARLVRCSRVAALLQGGLRAGSRARAPGGSGGRVDAGPRAQRCRVPADRDRAHQIAGRRGLAAAHVFRSLDGATHGSAAGFERVHGMRRSAERKPRYFHPLQDGLLCANDKRLASQEMSAEPRGLAMQMFRQPLDKFVDAPWPRQRALDLRKFLVQLIERHIEKKLVTATMLDRLE
jgi:Recombinational DNA repair protein (RecF pathway)